jgi:alpha-N-arabinofuranosidase
VLVPDVDCSTLVTERYGAVPAVTAAATLDPDDGTWCLFLTNRSETSMPLDLELAGLGPDGVPTARTLPAGTTGGTETPFSTVRVSSGTGGALHLTLPPESWTVLEAGKTG